ncbi:hypothetical protein DPMN_041302 [Dreissena polymorpha]|uniref:Uncharacterized protein n=1 Tax=Dreissena polymorpha TaxID=45954 RepID=A0A9D4CWZ5_DREPO|nr:hypothetical protein DPMN_041302 [Dreissena polymorpha]
MINPKEHLIGDIYDLPQGTFVIVRGKIVQLDDVQSVLTSYGAQTEVRNRIVSDETASIPFALWRQLASSPLSVNDNVKIYNAVVSKTTNGEPKLSGNQKTTIEFLAPDAIPVTKGSSSYEEQGEVVGFSDISVYKSCSRQPCHEKKLVQNKCPKCLTNYDDESNKLSMSCSIGLLQEENITTVTIFTPQIRQLIEDLHLEEKNNSILEERMLNILPIKVGFTRSPRKDSNTLSLLKKL